MLDLINSIISKMFIHNAYLTTNYYVSTHWTKFCSNRYFLFTFWKFKTGAMDNQFYSAYLKLELYTNDPIPNPLSEQYCGGGAFNPLQWALWIVWLPLEGYVGNSILPILYFINLNIFKLYLLYKIKEWFNLGSTLLLCFWRF